MNKFCTVENVKSNRLVEAEILSMTDKVLKVSIKGTPIIVSLSRKSLKEPYVGEYGSNTFESYGS